jgi:hypothetical protein
MPAQAQMTRDDRVRRMAMQLVEVAKTKHGRVTFGPGVLLVLPAKAALARLVELHKQAVGERSPSVHIRKLPSWGARILHRRETVSALATLTAVKPEFRETLVKAILAFARERRSIEGIESLVLSAVISAKYELPALAKEGRHVLTTCGSPRVLGGGYAQTPVVDSLARQMTFADPQAVGEFINGKPGGATPGIGNPVPGGFGNPGNTVADQSDCVKTWTVVGTIVGAVGGGLLGAVAGNSTTDSKGTWTGVGIGGGVLAGSLGGAQGGQALGQGAFCPNASPGTAAPSNPSAGGVDGSQWEQNLINSADTSNASSPQDQQDYSDGFNAGWAAAQSSGGSADPPSGSDSFGAGFADGYGAASAMQTLPQPGGGAPDSSGGGSAPESSGGGGAPDSGGGGAPESGGGSAPDSSGGGSAPEGSGGSGGSMANPEGGGDEGPSSGTSALFHHVNPAGPGMKGLTTTDDGQGGGDEGGGTLDSLGSKIVTLPPNLPDPENNPHARTSLQRAALAQAVLLSEVVATNLSKSLIG